MTKHYLELDSSVVAAGLSPVELAAENQDCYIYCPAFATYVVASTSSPVMKEQDSKYVQTDSDIRGHGKNWKLRCQEGGKFHIVSLNDAGEENGFLYLSTKIQSGVLHRSSNIMKSNEIVKGKEKQYLFDVLESGSQWGLYMIKCGDKTLFASKGNNSNLLAEAKDDSCLDIWFQFNLKTRITKIDPTEEEKLFDVLTENSFEDSFVFTNGTDATEHVKFNRRDKEFVKVDPKSQDDEAPASDKASADLFPTESIPVEAKGKTVLQFTATLKTYVKVTRVKLETEVGKTFTAFKQQRCFHNERAWQF